MQLRSRGYQASSHHPNTPDNEKLLSPPVSVRETAMAPGGNTQGDPTVNRFEIRKLVFVLQKESSSAEQEERVGVPPPIVVPHPPDGKPTVKITLTKALPETAFVTKNRNFVTQILANDFKVYSLIIRELEKNKMEFYEYPTPDKKTRKYVLYGLNSEETPEEIESDLKKYGLQPDEIIKMKLNRPKFEGHSNFIVSFDAADRITLKMLQGVKYVCHSVVRWAHYTPLRSDIIQCKNCTRIGHRAHGCHLKPVCMFCAKSHNYTKCPLIKQKEQLQLQRIPDFLTKCGLCSGQHTAFSEHCPRRIAHINKRMNQDPEETAPATMPPQHTATRTTLSSKQIAPTRTRSASPTPNKPQRTWELPSTVTASMNSDTVEHFPTPMESRGRPRKKTVSSIPSAKKPQTNNNSHNVSKTTTSKPPNSNPVFDNSHYTQHMNDNDSFSPQELTSIFHEIIQITTTHTTKATQLQALMNLAMKYLTCQN